MNAHILHLPFCCPSLSFTSLLVSFYHILPLLLLDCKYITTALSCTHYYFDHSFVIEMLALCFFTKLRWLSNVSKILQVDVVYVGTIHPSHLHCVQLMLKYGKPVLCEKPLTMNVRDTSLLIENFTKSGVFLMEVKYLYGGGGGGEWERTGILKLHI